MANSHFQNSDKHGQIRTKNFFRKKMFKMYISQVKKNNLTHGFIHGLFDGLTHDLTWFD